MRIVVDPYPEAAVLDAFWRRAWGGAPPHNYAAVLQRSLTHLGAFVGARLVGFVNVAWDGGVHAFILDTAVDPDYRRQGIATRLVAAATEAARTRGADWLHVDFEPHLTGFYRECGFRHTEAGLIRLR
ncbi:GNAT family N-acetyltransferase [Devosia sediminis]|uniref:GNAT family N-acetyltransferase n=1 Tax=Devosia sediminis TaxID=2798801 RepID=A0A934MPN7_9HYPH|nr:GNAT family N-acetyltransferase [Devosia sediminis]MBJ3783514.1 GNAT family N-acetyltransferase [Devosia sediminis]